MAIRTLRCPHCGYRFKADPAIHHQQGDVTLVRRKSETPRAQDQQTVDLTCPKCKNDFETEVKA